VVTIVVAAVLLAFAAPAWAHTVAVTGTTSCPGGNHLVSWTIHNNETSADRSLTIVSATATVGGNTYAVTGYDATLPPQGDTPASTTIPGDVTGTVTITVNVRWPDNFRNHATGTVDLVEPCTETTTTTSASTTTSTPSTTATSGPPVTGGTAPSTLAPGGGQQSGQQSGVAGVEAGSGALPRTGGDTTNWTLVGLTAIAFGALLLAVSSKRVARG
jgi:LPXTG-motif cell wall-anchored protein